MLDSNITQERAARRYAQIAVLERQRAIVQKEIADCKDHLKDLRKAHDGLTERMRTAARDDGELPLFNLDETV